MFMDTTQKQKLFAMFNNFKEYKGKFRSKVCEPLLQRLKKEDKTTYRKTHVIYKIYNLP